MERWSGATKLFPSLRHSITPICLLAALFLASLLAGCKPPPLPEPGSGGGHAHAAPHGGTLVQLGDHQFNLEFVAGPDGRLSAYVLDAHAENFVRINALSFKVTAKFDGHEETLEFKPVANPATGETAGSTSEFLATAEWLKTTAAFEGVLQELAVKGTIYRAIAFKFAKPN
jgi:hypothetical protein